MAATAGGFDNWGEVRKIIINAILTLILIVALFCLIGCRTVYVDRPVTHTEYVYRDRVDSVNIHDSIYIKEQIKGDTVTRIEYRYRDRFKYIFQTDTLIQRDTVSVVRTEVVEKTVAKMNGLQRVFFWTGIILTMLIIGFVIGKILKIRLL